MRRAGIVTTLPFIVLIRLGTFHFFDLNSGLWRYVSVRDLVQIIKGAVLSSVLVGVVVYPVVGFYSYPRSVVVMDSIVLIMLMGGIRVGTRLFRERNRLHFFDFDKKPVFIYGAGDAGELLLRDMQNNSRYNYQPVGFIDDDERKKGLKIHSVPVLGAGKDLEKLIKKFEPREIIVAIPSAKPAQMRTILNECKKYDVTLKTLPSLKDVITGDVSVNQIKDISIEDLLCDGGLKADR